MFSLPGAQVLATVAVFKEVAAAQHCGLVRKVADDAEKIVALIPATISPATVTSAIAASAALVTTFAFATFAAATFPATVVTASLATASA